MVKMETALEAVETKAEMVFVIRSRKQVPATSETLASSATTSVVTTPLPTLEEGVVASLETKVVLSKTVAPASPLSAASAIEVLLASSHMAQSPAELRFLTSRAVALLEEEHRSSAVSARVAAATAAMVDVECASHFREVSALEAHTANFLTALVVTIT